MCFLAGFLTGSIVMLAALLWVAILYFSKKDKTLLSRSSGDFLIEAGNAVKNQAPKIHQ